ncbi:hypothetical protein G9P44_003448 [Scheffersomyces stipitis]|nr:hypothetical protein G9P44_003448 [Scheffersomyces stipitis]
MASLKSFIKAVRKAKTIADERAVVRKESAAIRTSFRDVTLDQTTRRINISKLLYLYIMGEKTHFGQVECLKLLASPRFVDKRLGYLAASLLLDENQEVLTLLTNSLDNDMQHPNAYIVGLALCCLGNIASPELARDLYQNVEKIIASNNVYLKKKACIVAAKLVEKEPDLFEFFLPKIGQLLSDKSPAVLLGALRLTNSLYLASEDTHPVLVKNIPKIISHLKRVNTSGYQPDYDVMGTADPFLQVALLSTLRTLATDEYCPDQHLEEINDILTQVASNLDSGKNAAHAILYECVRTIFAIQSDQSLKILGVNLLGKFLSTKENNTRYVALDSLLSVISIEPLAVQRHRSTIVNCLSDGDISIRRRALELSFAILNEQNIRVLVREILTFLENCNDNELKPYVTSQLTIAANKYSPNEKWHFDTLIRMLKLSGDYVTSDNISSILALILQCNDNELKKHIVQKLLTSCLEDSTQFGLSLITVWSLGEYADLVLGTNVEVHSKEILVTDKVVLDLIDNLINNSTYSESETVQLITYILTAVIKLSVKFSDGASLEHLRQILNARTYDNNLEIQVRAVEYQEIFAQDVSLKRGLLARMPAPPVKERESLTLQKANNKAKRVGSSPNSGVPSTTEDLLLDLMDDNGDSNGVNGNKDATALLSDIFGGSNGTVSASQNNNAAILDLFNTSPAAPAAPIAVATPQEETNSIPAFSNNFIKVSFVPKSFPSNGEAIIEALVDSNSASTVEQFQFLIAVPKTQKLTISSSSEGDTLVPGGRIKQVLKLAGKQGSKVKFRVKAKYTVNGNAIEEQFDFGAFSQTL